jgi:hypothetical protein
MSIDASGSLAGAIVFSKWRGRNYVRRHAVPANPRSEAQLSMRAIIAFLSPQWVSVSGGDQSTWEPAADAAKISEFNQFVKINARNWRDSLMPSMAFPALRVQTPATVSWITATAVGRQAQVVITQPGGASAWGLVLCRSLITGFTPSAANAVLCSGVSALSITLVDGPLAPGTYFYNAFFFSEDGKIGAAGTEDSVTIT